MGLGDIDLVVFGSPCQDLSIAGKGEGLNGKRSGLFHDAIRIIGWARKHCNCRFALWENVAGSFSSNEGGDFAAVVEQMAGLINVDVPKEGWGREGLALGDDAMLEWSTLDSQWFGVAQRRRRVFALSDFGDWQSRQPILLEPESLRGDSAPSREAGEEITGSLTSRTNGGGGLGTDFECSGGLQPVAEGFRMTAFGEYSDDDTASTVKARDFKDATDLAVSSVNGSIAHTLTQQHDSSEDGSGRGTPIIAFPGRLSHDDIPKEATKTTPTIQAGNPTAIAYSIIPQNSGKDYKARAVEVSQPLMAGGPVGGNQGGDFILDEYLVRRLTPKECERLQAFPDDFTLIEYRGKPAADAPRYKALGNSMTVNVMRWIGEKIESSINNINQT